MNLSPAERVRSMLAVGLELRLDGERHARHVVMPDGSILLRRTDGLDCDGVVVLTGTDVASVPQPDRVRGGFRMAGLIGPWEGPRPEGIVRHLAGPAGHAEVGVLGAEELAEIGIVRFRPEEISLSWHCETLLDQGPVRVELADYVAAAPDPLVAAEQTWLPHLQRDHGRELRALARRGYSVLDETIRVRALALDTHGVVLRLYADTDHLDVRVDFAEPATCADEVRAAFAELLEAPQRRR